MGSYRVGHEGSDLPAAAAKWLTFPGQLQDIWKKAGRIKYMTMSEFADKIKILKSLNKLP